ncbi:interferon-induced GTP-binding protein Mx2 [Akanthomyces lecanii RCEF 1005]|uniref:Interferon-induced GTP-binding protein Mx2 n=1 Tax=Akanthomyces lecanii RCEF 1005 TaxID=1081108 RepID=A0A168J686_CORDF|nr:interferon-induced GTP-binding protein Mx2 [Akanthomyces lecanii RCEF 1005]
MGIRTIQNPTGTRTFSENVLKIEKCGPSEDYLTVIDVPGIFRATEKDITTSMDKSLVLSMVQNYIRDDQTIILAVLPSNVDIGTQEILDMAELYDPSGQRTLGVLTKPDLVRERSAQSGVCNLINGKKKPLNLGYHLVRSRGGDDDGNAFSDVERDIMFREEPWCHLPTDRLGVVALRQRLQHLLGELIDRAFPKLRAETREMLTQARKDLGKLGQSRKTEREQQQYLTSIASGFQDIVRPALNADYSSSEVFDNDNFRLITTVLNMTDEFKTTFTATAHTYQFLERSQNSNEDSDFDDDSQPFSISDFGEDGILFDRYPDLDSVINRECNDCPPLKGIMDWIKKVHRRSRGSELTSYNASLFASALRQQTSKWQILTEFFVSKIVYKIHEFIVIALGVVCSDTKVREELLSQMLDAILERYGAAMDQARLLIEVERDGQPYTLNNAFKEALSSLQSARTEQDLSSKLKSVEFNDNRQGHAISLGDIQATLRDKNRGKYIAEEVHDLIKSYYEVARDRFIDNIYLQVIAHSLVSGSNSPLRLFCEKWVLNLETEKLDAIAGESFHTREQRERLIRTIKDLEQAADILR